MNRPNTRNYQEYLDSVQLPSAQEIMEKALEISSNNVIVYDIKERVIRQLNGTMMAEGGIIDLETYKRHVHPDDVDMVIEGVRSVIYGQRKSVEFSYRWNFNFGEGEPQWGYLYNTSVAEYLPGSDKPVNVVSTLVDESALRQQQQEEEELSSRYKLIFEHSIIGLSFYTPDGWLIHANRIMREICNFDSDDGDAFFGSNNLFDMPPFNEVLDRRHVEEFWACSQSIVPERNMHVYLEIRLHPIYNEEGKIAYLAIAVRDITEEREMYLKAKENDRQIQRAKEAIQLYESELRYMMEACEMQSWRISLDRNVIEFYSGLSTVTRTFPLEQLPKVFVNQEDDFVKSLSNPAEAFSRPLFYVGKMHPVVSGKHTEQQWVQINAIPEYDEHGRLKGVFGVWRNIMSIMQKQEQLKRETERANDSGRMKSVFLANMTHEIRTPLNAIVGFSDLLQAIEDDNEKREMIRIIHNNCDMLLRLINDILVLSNVDTNAMQIMAEPVDFNSVFEDICHSLAQRVTEPGIEFQKDSPGEPLLISIDKRRIQQVITNFVTNSVKYTRQGHIRVGYRLESHPSPLTSNLYVYCEDTGTGIPENQRQRIFERFVKLNDYIQGTGLGLSICKAIVDKCGGEIGVDSEEGKGSTFWFRIPVKSEE